MTTADTEFQVSKKILTRLRMFKFVKVHPDIYISEDFNIDFNLIRVGFEKDLVADRLADDVYHGGDYAHFDIPETTFQMFKHRNQEKWWLRRFVAKHPVRYVTHTQWVPVEIEVGRYITYPEAKIEDSSRLGRPFIYEQVNQVERDTED